MSGRYRFCRLFFTKGLALVYAAAFLSVARQATGLLGEHGILPVGLFLHGNGAALGSPLRVPSLFWLGASDAALVVAALAGVVLAGVVLAGIDGALVWGALWALYLSFVDVGQVFYRDPGDLLLLEVGFLAIFIPERPFARFRAALDPPAVLVWLLRILLFRVLVGAGIAKLRSDPCWSSLKCLPGYLETQPSPTAFAYYAHELTLPLQRIATFVVLFSEVVVPFGVFGPRPVRRVAGVVTIVVRGVVTLVANGGFSAWLVALVAFACLDDECFARLRWAALAGEPSGVPSRLRRGVLSALAVVVIGLGVAQFGALWSPMPGGEASIEPLHLVNVYGAIEPVESERDEVVFEGTRDDVAAGPAHFEEYELPCKAGDPRRAPCWPTLNPRRLDLRLWQAALGDFRREDWVIRVVDALLRGNPAVTSLFERNPFPGKPPRFVRARRYRYRFATGGEPRYWHREPLDEFIRPISLDDPALYEYLFHKGWLSK